MRKWHQPVQPSSVAWSSWCLCFLRLTMFDACSYDWHGIASENASGQRRVKGRRWSARLLQSHGCGWAMICRSPLIRQMTRRPPITLARAGQVRSPESVARDQTHLVLLAAVSIYQLNACLNSSFIDHLCRPHKPTRLNPVSYTHLTLPTKRIV